MTTLDPHTMTTPQLAALENAAVEAMLDEYPELSSSLSMDHKLLVAQKKLQYILKDSRNNFGKYDYVSADSYIGACRKALLGVRLFLKRTFAYDRTDMTVTVFFELKNPDTGESFAEPVVLPIVERGGMPEDKATLAAVSTATSYYLQGLFMLPRLDKTPELDEIDDRASVPGSSVTKTAEPPMPEDLYEKVEELQQVLAHGGKEVTVKDLMGLLRGRAKDANKTLDAAFVTACIAKAKGTAQ